MQYNVPFSSVRTFFAAMIITAIILIIRLDLTLIACYRSLCSRHGVKFEFASESQSEGDLSTAVYATACRNG